MFTIGIFNVTADPGTGALCVREVRHFKPSEATNERPIYEEFQGYMIRKRRRYLCIQRNVLPQNPNFVISVFNDEFIDSDENARIFSLGGIAFGTAGSRMYISRVYVERCEPEMTYENLKTQINYVSSKELKPSVLKYLSLDNQNFYHVF